MNYKKLESPDDWFINQLVKQLTKLLQSHSLTTLILKQSRCCLKCYLKQTVIICRQRSVPAHM